MSVLEKSLAAFAQRAPKMLSPRAHAAVDYALAGSCFLAGALYWRRNRRAALGAIACGTASALNALFTDYPGGVSHQISFPAHGRIDASIAALSAAVPSTMGFASEPEANFFRGHAAATTLAVALTQYTPQQDSCAADELETTDGEEWEGFV